MCKCFIIHLRRVSERNETKRSEASKLSPNGILPTNEGGAIRIEAPNNNLFNESCRFVFELTNRTGVEVMRLAMMILQSTMAEVKFLMWKDAFAF